MPQKNQKDMTFLLTEAGAPFTAAGFDNWFRDRRNEAGLPHCSAHGLRKACATRLAKAGCTPEQIKAITGHKTLSEVARCTKAADQERNAKPALANLLRSESEQACLIYAPRLDKSGEKWLCNSNLKMRWRARKSRIGARGDGLDCGASTSHQQHAEPRGRNDPR
jgi:hypothetical protein